MIHFTPRDDDSTDPDRTLTIEGTDIVVGWIEQGRPMPGGEWRFVPNTPDTSISFPIYKGKGISPAYADARAYAATLPQVTS